MGPAVKLISAIILAAVLIALVPVPSGSLQAAPAPQSDSLFAQSVARQLARDFNRAGLSYLLLDVTSGGVLAYRWPDSDQPVPVGSLVKPFTALAYGRAHDHRYPQHRCTPGQCWLPRGHGQQDMVSAIANSCNAYFRALSRSVSSEQIASITHDFQIPGPGRADADTLIGVGREWPIAPLAMAQAYAELARRRTQPDLENIIAGMRLSASRGTGAAVGRRLASANALVKTGTAHCTHSPRGSADGFVVALVPADTPRLLLLLRVHGSTGAQAAVTAGQILHAVGEQPSLGD